jgi:hypothetical protein
LHQIVPKTVKTLVTSLFWLFSKGACHPLTREK